MERAIYADICKNTENDSSQCIDCKIRDSVQRLKKKCPKTHYLVIVECSNCQFSNVVMIPKGTTVVKYTNELMCTYCLCQFNGFEDEVLKEERA